jgi:hypothetical protein
VRNEREKFEEAFKRSYIDELKENKGHIFEKTTQNNNVRGGTIDPLP